jgi:hypothetical protein
VIVLGVTDHHAAIVVGYLNAVATVTAKAGLPPADIYCFHRSFATFMMRSRDSARGKA